MGDGFTLLGFYINNKLEILETNLDCLDQKVNNLINKWKPDHLFVHDQITIAKSMLISQYTYIVTILDIRAWPQIKKLKFCLGNS